ncbi:hypothetical protein LJC20_05740 [Eubacteriales bacterium OttesenSCG-928-M02]|nr:hypothetical protein [Eubacteriales bacterium OttesenSCG-928-M02]
MECYRDGAPIQMEDGDLSALFLQETGTTLCFLPFCELETMALDGEKKQRLMETSRQGIWRGYENHADFDLLHLHIPPELVSTYNVSYANIYLSKTLLLVAYQPNGNGTDAMADMAKEAGEKGFSTPPLFSLSAG